MLIQEKKMRMRVLLLLLYSLLSQNISACIHRLTSSCSSSSCCFAVYL